MSPNQRFVALRLNYYLINCLLNYRACSKFNVQQKSSGDNLKDGYVKAFVYNSYGLFSIQ